MHVYSYPSILALLAVLLFLDVEIISPSLHRSTKGTAPPNGFGTVLVESELDVEPPGLERARGAFGAVESGVTSQVPSANAPPLPEPNPNQHTSPFPEQPNACQPPLLVSIIDYDFTTISADDWKMIGNFVNSLRKHSDMEFLALTSSETRCDAFAETYGEECDVLVYPEEENNEENKTNEKTKWKKQAFAFDLKKRLASLGRAIVLTDVDSVIDRDPLPLFTPLVCDHGFDFIGGHEGGWKINSGMMLFANSEVGFLFVNCISDWIEQVGRDPEGSFQKHVLAAVPLTERDNKTSDPKFHGATSISFEQDVVMDCARRLVTGDDEMRFSTIIARRRVAGAVTPPYGELTYQHPDVHGMGYLKETCGEVRGRGVTDNGNIKTARVLDLGIRCAKTHESVANGKGLIAVASAPFYAGPEQKKADKSTVAFHHCVGKSKQCLYGEVE